jgi:uncharacterized protein GlcG (DUF336 family)
VVHGGETFQDSVERGGIGLRVTMLRGAMPVEGGVPLVIDGKIVGGLGVSGGTAEQDGQCCKAATDGM